MHFMNESLLVDPYPLYAQWRATQPIWWAQDVQGWVVSRYDDVRRILKDPVGFSSLSMGDMREQAMALPLLSDDPPRHTQLRAIVNKAFTSRTLKSMEAAIAVLAEQRLEALDPSEAIDISAQFTTPLPVEIISRLMDIPLDRKSDFKRWSDALTGTGEADALQERLPDIMDMAGFFQSLIPARREQPGDDLLSRIVNTEVDGHRLCDQDIVGFAILLLIAGNETTTNLLGNLLHYLVDHADTWRQLRRQPAAIDAAIEEILRYDAPVQWVNRRATCDTKIQGQTVKAGDTVFAIIGSANRDEHHYEQAETFRLDRPNRTDHLSFGLGIHFCIGAPLGRLEARFAVAGLLRRFSSLRRAKHKRNERTHSN
ncbi:MAG: cytochrome P450, partial [Halioglobus sp.]|nr:cytochrome P450 [Halioglobus sp.]